MSKSGDYLNISSRVTPMMQPPSPKAPHRASSEREAPSPVAPGLIPV